MIFLSIATWVFIVIIIAGAFFSVRYRQNPRLIMSVAVALLLATGIIYSIGLQAVARYISMVAYFSLAAATLVYFIYSIRDKSSENTSE